MKYVIRRTYHTTIWHTDDLAGVGITSELVGVMLLCHPDDIHYHSQVSQMRLQISIFTTGDGPSTLPFSIHLPLVPYIYASVNWVSIGSDNGLSPDRRQVITLTNAHLMSIGPFREIWIKIQSCSFKKMRLKMSSAKWLSFCLGLNVLITPPLPPLGAGPGRPTQLWLPHITMTS